MSSFILDICLANYQKANEKQQTSLGFTLDYRTSAKFENDKINYQNDNYYLLLDGIVLNKKQLLTESNESNWTKYLIKSYEKVGNQFFKLLKGSNYGFLYDKKEEKWIVFTDHISSKPIYFSKYDNHICFANNYTELVNHLKQKKQTLSLDEQAAWLLITYGFVFEEITIIKEIRRLMVGYNSVIKHGQLQLEKFYTLTNDPIGITEAEAIEEIDIRFKNAVQLAFDKDKEYGYSHVATLSGGLDSRMTVWVAHELGYTKQLNLTFSQSNYLDENIAKQIAGDLKHEWLFKALDNGNFLENIDETTR